MQISGLKIPYFGYLRSNVFLFFSKCWFLSFLKRIFKREESAVGRIIIQDFLRQKDLSSRLKETLVSLSLIILMRLWRDVGKWNERLKEGLSFWIALLSSDLEREFLQEMRTGTVGFLLFFRLEMSRSSLRFFFLINLEIVPFFYLYCI